MPAMGPFGCSDPKYEEQWRCGEGARHHAGLMLRERLMLCYTNPSKSFCNFALIFEERLLPLATLGPMKEIRTESYQASWCAPSSIFARMHTGRALHSAWMRI
jgi:hypothetical protein